MFEPRSETRDPCEIYATVVTESLDVRCLVENLSEKGARLAFDCDVELPSTFELRLPLFDQVVERRRVERRWQLGRHCGVRFVLNHAH